MIAPPCGAGPSPCPCGAATERTARLGHGVWGGRACTAPVHHAVRLAVLAERVLRRSGRQSANTQRHGSIPLGYADARSPGHPPTRHAPKAAARCRSTRADDPQGPCRWDGVRIASLTLPRVRSRGVRRCGALPHPPHRQRSPSWRAGHGPASAAPRLSGMPFSMQATPNPCRKPLGLAWGPAMPARAMIAMTRVEVVFRLHIQSGWTPSTHPRPWHPPRASLDRDGQPLEIVRERARSLRRRRERPRPPRRCGVPLDHAEGAVQLCLGMLHPVPRLRSEGHGVRGRGAWSRAHRDDRLRRPGGSAPPHALCSSLCTPPDTRRPYAAPA